MDRAAAVTWQIFDCDGVLLDSARVKSRAFRDAALPYGEDAAAQLVEYHRRAGSIGREARLLWFFRAVLGREPGPGEMEAMNQRLTASILHGTLCAPKVPGVEAFLRANSGRCAVVSGIETEELRLILEHHGLSSYFEYAWGGPRSKALIFREMRHRIDGPAVYYGDTEQDYLDARNAGLEFVWVRGCSEWAGMRSIVDFREVPG